jgi:hypothetical protein
MNYSLDGKYKYSSDYLKAVDRNYIDYRFVDEDTGDNGDGRIIVPVGLLIVNRLDIIDDI